MLLACMAVLIKDAVFSVLQHIQNNFSGILTLPEVHLIQNFGRHVAEGLIGLRFPTEGYGGLLYKLIGDVINVFSLLPPFGRRRWWWKEFHRLLRLPRLLAATWLLLSDTSLLMK